ncbi:hypothetical protein J7K44_00605, partial [bacterium]|nr:hypothetical protein [bacterium]
FRRLIILNSILIIFLFAFCIFQIISISYETYQVVNYEKRIKELSQENKELEILLSQKSSLKDLESKAKNLGFEPINKIYYVRIFEGEVAKKEK